MAVKQVSAESAVAPNLVPMVDIMFLLLLFFMLGADMGQRELEEVRLPVASSVQAERPETDPAAKRLTLNVYHDSTGACADYDGAQLCANREHWSIGIKGEDFREGAEAALEARLLGEADVERGQRGVERTPDGRRPASELEVTIRADRAALYSFVQRAMNACGTAGIYRVEVGAASPLE